ncbi:MAG: LacI family DNA-binding transcriptional regulator [Geminicoccaceae bacterium]|nr:LacI family DNA-binding transcriptional regulator [Geminicoccaceae bacterium]
MARESGGATTLADVAREAGVSVITVSRVIRNAGPISDKTRDKVMKAVRKTGYRPNPIAVSLVSRASNLIAVIIPSLSNIVYADVLRGINETVTKGGFRTTFGLTEYDMGEELRLVESLLAWRPAALFLAGVEHLPETEALIRQSNVRCIEFMELRDDPLDVVIGFSHEEAGRQSARYLLSRGYERIGYVGHDLKRDLRAARRYRAFRETVEEAGYRLIDERVVDTQSSVEAGRASTADILAEPGRIDAIYFSNDDMAIGGYFHCLAAGIGMPDDLAIMGFNGLDIGQQMPQRLTTILTRRLDIGRHAGEAALALNSDRTVAPIQNIGFDLIAGETT